MEQQIIQDAEFLQQSAALVRTFENGDTLRTFDMYKRLGVLVKEHLNADRTIAAMDYLAQQGIIQLSEDKEYMTYIPIK